MKRAIYSIVYWLASVTIGLGALGHGVGGANALRTGLASVTLAPDIAGLIWVVWYFVSGCMLLFGVVAAWAWFAAARGVPDALVAPSLIGGFYLIFGVAALMYGRDAFWLLFTVEGVMLLGASLGLRKPVRSA